MPPNGFLNDTDYWIRWNYWIRQTGFSYIYAYREVNYFPVLIFIIAGFGSFFTNFTDLVAKIHLIKIPIFFFDIASVYLAGKIFKANGKSPYWSLLILFNPAYFYITILWGQFEAVYTFFILGSLIAALSKKANISCVFFTLAFFSKIQAIVFLPVIGLILIPQYWHNKESLLKSFFLVFLITLFLILPFYATASMMFNNVFGSLNQYPNLSLSAFNYWYMIFGGEYSHTLDSGIPFLLSYKAWGFVMVFMTAIIAAIPIVAEYISKYKEKFSKDFFRLVFLTSGMLCFILFYFATEIHERYLYPTIIMLGIAALLKPSKSSIGLYAAVSVLFLLNLEKINNYFNIFTTQSAIFSSRVISIAFFIALLWGLLELFKGRKFKEDIKTIGKFIKPKGKHH